MLAGYIRSNPLSEITCDEDEKIITYAMTSLLFTNGKCPHCGEVIGKNGSICYDEVAQHIAKKKEREQWKIVMDTITSFF
ncbi:MAG: hypothetical protein MUP55_03930 [Candidatus Aenigmarchaeota archaeon]|nr:hypothetical protein [Candidatus Aenigmarchaeota archaeon]